MNNTTPIASISHVSKTYGSGPQAVHALRDVSLAILPGELVAAAGPSGSGKTTLLNLIGCLDRPNRGTIHLGGLQVSHLPASALPRVRREKLGFVFQAFNLVPILTVYQNVEYPLLLQGVAAAERRRRVGELLERVGIADKAAHHPNQLSAGQRQRAAVARALINRPSLVLADEPTANLDSVNGAAVLDLISEMRAQLGTSFFFASHDPRLLARVDRIALMRDGMLDHAASPRLEEKCAS
jgi:putative ABC transport system ATP-binding protein